MLPKLGTQKNGTVEMELKRFFPIDKAACEAISNYNVAPSQEILAIAKYEGENWLVKFHWGLVPFWAKDISIGNRMINARSESIAEKPSFRNAFKKRRCLILADGFYEWKGMVLVDPGTIFVFFIKQGALQKIIQKR